MVATVMGVEVEIVGNTELICNLNSFLTFEFRTHLDFTPNRVFLDLSEKLNSVRSQIWIERLKGSISSMHPLARDEVKLIRRLKAESKTDFLFPIDTARIRQICRAIAQNWMTIAPLDLKIIHPLFPH